MALNLKNRPVLLGAAVAVGLLSSLSKLFRSEQSLWSQKTSDNTFTKSFIIGSLVGGVVGAASALLLAPKSGKKLVEDIANSIPFVHNHHFRQAPARSATKKSQSSNRPQRKGTASTSHSHQAKSVNSTTSKPTQKKHYYQ